MNVMKSTGRLLQAHLWQCKELWTELLELSKRMYADFGYFPTLATLQSLTKYQCIFSQTAQEISHRLHSSLQRIMEAFGERKTTSVFMEPWLNPTGFNMATCANMRIMTTGLAAKKVYNSKIPNPS